MTHAPEPDRHTAQGETEREAPGLTWMPFLISLVVLVPFAALITVANRDAIGASDRSLYLLFGAFMFFLFGSGVIHRNCQFIIRRRGFHDSLPRLATPARVKHFSESLSFAPVLGLCLVSPGATGWLLVGEWVLGSLLVMPIFLIIGELYTLALRAWRSSRTTR